MPIIVPIEDNKVGLATATDAKFRAPDYSGSGLEALGAGLAQLGGGGQQLASGLEERRRRAAEAIAAAMLDDRHQSNIDDAAVKKAYVDYSGLAHEALHREDGLFNQQGADARRATAFVRGHHDHVGPRQVVAPARLRAVTYDHAACEIHRGRYIFDILDRTGLRIDVLDRDQRLVRAGPQRPGQRRPVDRPVGAHRHDRRVGRGLSGKGRSVRLLTVARRALPLLRREPCRRDGVAEGARDDRRR